MDYEEDTIEEEPVEDEALYANPAVTLNAEDESDSVRDSHQQESVYSGVQIFRTQSMNTKGKHMTIDTSGCLYAEYTRPTDIPADGEVMYAGAADNGYAIAEPMTAAEMSAMARAGGGDLTYDEIGDDSGDEADDVEILRVVRQGHSGAAAAGHIDATVIEYCEAGAGR
jgi:hypothetical protein